MNKKCLISLIIIMMLMVPLVSAGLWGDIYNLITGRTTEAVVEPEPVPEQEPVTPEPEPVPPEEPVPPIRECPTMTPPHCPDGETICPSERVEGGCPTWDCNACPKENECPPLEVVRQPSCPDCMLECKSCCFCPQGTDEQGCPVWDCDACPIVEEIIPPPIEIPPGCRRLVLDNGMEVIECEEECPPIPEDFIRKCEESDGQIIERTDYRGCPSIDCQYETPEPPEFGRPTDCPSKEELSERKEKCIEAGLEPVLLKSGECEIVKCRGSHREFRESCVEDIEIKKRIKEECEIKGGNIMKQFDSRGCPITVCASVEECAKDVPPEAHENCEFEGGNLIVKRNSQGCIIFVDCIRRGKQEIEYEEIDEIPPAAKLLSVALKLESLKIEFDKLSGKVKDIAGYYEDTGNEAEAEKFRRVAGLFSSAKDQLEDIKVKLREMASWMTIEDLREIKHDIKYISETIMQDALYIILGGEIELEGSTGVTEGGYTDCGSDDRCWKEALRLCERVVFKPSGSGITAKIHGLEGEVCVLEAHADGMSMICKVEDYATLNPDGPEILQYCEGDLVEMLKKGQPGEQPEGQPGYGGRYGPAIVQNQEWYSKFDRRGLSDEFRFSGEQIKGGIKLNKIQGRGDVTVVQYPSEENGFETVILFDDDRFGNPDYYEISILDETGSIIFTFEDCIDGSDYLIIKGNTVKYRHRNYQNPGEHEACRHLVRGFLGDETEEATQQVTRETPTKTAEDCEKLTGVTEKDKCYENIALIQINDASLGLCEKITDSHSMGSCILTVAKETNDAGLCEMLPEMFSKGSCYHTIAIKTKDVSLCEKITDKLSIRLKYMCYSVLTNNANMCEELLSGFDKDVCYSNFAVETRDASFCENIVDIEITDACYNDITMYTKDASLCEKITPDSKRQKECYTRAA